MPLRYRLRFLLLVVALLGVGCAFFLEAVSAWTFGMVTFTMKHGLVVFSAARQTSPLGFFAGIAAYGLAGITTFALAFWRMRVLIHPNDPSSQRIISSTISWAEEKAPSGLKPLWVGLVIAACFLFIYAVA